MGLQAALSGQLARVILVEFWVSLKVCMLAALAHNEWQIQIAGASKIADCRICAVFNFQLLTRCDMGGKKGMSLDSTAAIKRLYRQVLGFTPESD